MMTKIKLPFFNTLDFLFFKKFGLMISFKLSNWDQGVEWLTKNLGCWDGKTKFKSLDLIVWVFIFLQ